MILAQWTSRNGRDWFKLSSYAGVYSYVGYYKRCPEIGAVPAATDADAIALMEKKMTERKLKRTLLDPTS